MVEVEEKEIRGCGEAEAFPTRTALHHQLQHNWQKRQRLLKKKFGHVAEKTYFCMIESATLRCCNIL